MIPGSDDRYGDEERRRREEEARRRAAALRDDEQNPWGALARDPDLPF
jgi:hypothetical protein